MEDGLETKAPSFLVDQLLSYPQKSRIKQKKAEKTEKAKKAESAIWSCILILEEPIIRNKSFLGYGWHALNLSGCQLIKLVGE